MSYEVPYFIRYGKNAPFIVLVFIFFSAVPNSFECRHNALFSVLVFKMFSEVPYRIRWRKNVMHHLASLFSKLCLQFQIPSECSIYRPCFQKCVLCSKSFQIPQACTIWRPCFLKFSLHFQIVSNATRMHHLASLFLKFSL